MGRVLLSETGNQSGALTLLVQTDTLAPIVVATNAGSQDLQGTAVVSNPDGSFGVFWSTHSVTIDDHGLLQFGPVTEFEQIYSASGQKMGTVAAVAGPTSNITYLDAEGTASGGYVLLSETGNQSGALTLLVQTDTLAPIVVATNAGSQDLQGTAVVSNPDGSFGVFWSTHSVTIDDHGLLQFGPVTEFEQIYSASGQKMGTVATIAGPTSNITYLDAEGTASGGYVLLSETGNQSGALTLLVQTDTLAPIVVATNAGSQDLQGTAVVSNPDGSFGVFWSTHSVTIDDHGLLQFGPVTEFEQIYSASGQKMGTVATVAGPTSNITYLDAEGTKNALFTASADVVDFNNLLPAQQAAVIADTNVTNTYHGLGGNDVVTLPDAANYDVSLGIGTGQKLDWNNSTQFYTDSKSGESYKLFGGTGSYNIHLGAGTDKVTISGASILAANGNNTIYGGAGSNNINIIGNGDNHVIEGSGTSTVALTGSGTNTIDLGSGATTLSLSGSQQINLNFTATGEVVHLSNVTGFTGMIVVSGFQSGDEIDFDNLVDLTTSAEFGVAGELDVYNKGSPPDSSPLAKLIFPSKAFAETLEPKSINGGTRIKIDPSNNTLIDPSGISASGWTFIHSQEGFGGKNELAPYQGASDTSGMTVGLGVDFGGKLLTTQELSDALGANYTTNANFAFLATGIGKTGPTSLANLKNLPWRSTRVGPQSTAVSITSSQANALDSTAETKSYNELVKAYGSKWATVPDAARAVIMDMDFNFGLPKLRSFDFWDEVVAQDWAAAAKELLNWGGPANLRDRRKADYNELMTIPQLKNAPPTTVENKTSSSIISNVASYSFSVDSSTQYAIDPNGTSTYTLTSNTTSPDIATITLPASDAAQYSISFLVGSSWSSPQTAQPVQTVSVPSDVSAIRVTLLDSAGDDLVGASPFTFYVTFASAGTFSGAVTSPTTALASSILWQNPTTGQASIWNMSGSALVGGGPVTPSPGPKWTEIGSGDFNGDGHADILWQNLTTGQASVWEMNGSSLIDGGPVTPNPGPNWKAVGTGDFNHDGFSDILWQNANTGQASIWEMSGNTLLGGGTATPNAGLAWKAVGTGDFNHDGDADILWQNKNTGQVSIWEMHGHSLVGGGALTINPGTAWQAIGTGDFNQDSFSDILFQNKNTGQISVWEMNGTSLIGGGPVSANPGTSWHAIGTGGGGSDILLQNSVTGAASIWEMNGNMIAGGGPVSPSPGSSWRAVGLT